MRKKVLLLVNPMAGKQRIRTELIYVIDELTSTGYEPVVYTTQGSENTQKILKENDSLYDMVICCGGDGTFNEIMSATMLWDKKPELGYIPAGTTNDFAAGLKLAFEPKDAIKDIIQGKSELFDAGEFNDRFFSYVASFGIFTQTSYSTPQNMKNILGHTAYLLEGIREVPLLAQAGTTVRIEAGDRVIEDSFVFGAISNATSVGGIMKMSDDVVNLHDGLFEVMMIRMPKTLVDLSTIITCLNTMNYDSTMIEFFQTDHLKITTREDLIWSLDGERFNGGQEMEIRCIHNAFKIIKNS